MLNPGVDPILCCYYRSSRLKQYFKQGRALRTGTVIANTKDLDVGRRMCAENWKALRTAGEAVNRRLCEAEAADAKPAPDVATFYHVTRPSTTRAGLHAPGLRFGERVMAGLGALVGFPYLVAGFANRQLVERVGALLHAPYAPRQATYDLRRLQRKGLITKLPHGHIYRLTSVGRRVAVRFTKAYGRVLAPGLSALDLHFPDDVIERRPLSCTWHSFDKALDDFVEQQMVAA